ncbi:hypothetical protein [Alienimonas chondri]|uniref:Uncharacterized protein n=1 Tax=Alienimonas chondri TaxID=2681879 RepID=A0ABX1VD87_9PLAN|nr:hypothetical protein [Alienimonas chondri]NNJ25202.1 hypothetical protein [Alienimonas chondri]
MANHAAHTTHQATTPIPEVAALRPARRGAAGRAMGLLTRLSLGAAGAALMLAPADLLAAKIGPGVVAEVTAGWTAAEAAGVGLLAVAGVWTLLSLTRRPRWDVAPTSVRNEDARTREAESSDSETVSLPFNGAASKSAEARPVKRVDDVDPAAVRSTWSASASKVAHDEAESESPATIPFPAAAESADEEVVEETVASHQEWPEEWGDEGNEPSVIRFEDVPRTVEVGNRVVDLTEMDFDGGKEDLLKGLSKKERRTVRKALRVRERMLMRAA